MKRNENNQQVREAVEQKLENVEDWDIEEIEEIIFVDQIEGGEIERENFYDSVSKMGVPFRRKGRIPYEEFEKIASELLEFLKSSTNPKADIKDVLKMRTEKGVKQINGRIEKSPKIRQRDKPGIIERNEKIHNELKVLEDKKVKVNKSLMWSVYSIKRGEKRIERFEEEGQDIELLKLQNSFIDEETMELLYEMRSEYYGDD